MKHFHLQLRMAPGCSAAKGKHRNGACRTCKSGVCHDCCSCRRKTRGLPPQADVRLRPVAKQTRHHHHSAPAVHVSTSAIVPANVSASATVPADVPASATVPANVPASTNVTADVPASATVPANVPASTTVTADVPASATVTADVPASTNVTADVPASATVTADVPARATVTADVPASTTVTADVPASTTVTADVPASATVTADVPASATVPELPDATTVLADTTVPANITSDAAIVADDPSNYGSRDFICHVLSLLGTEAYSDISRMPSVDHRNAARVKEDLTADGFRRIQSIFWKGVKGWVKLLLPAWSLPDDKVLKKIFCIPGAEAQDKNEADANAGGDTVIGLSSHSHVTANIIKAIKHEKSFHTLGARHLLAPLGNLPTKFWLEHLNMKESLVAELKFQAQVDAEYQHHGLPLQQYSKSLSRINDSAIKCLVDFVYSDENVTRLAWVACKLKQKNKRFSELQYISAMKSLVLKYDIATMYRSYLETVEEQIDQKLVGKSLFRKIVQHITGGGKKQDARAGVDYVKVNYHTDNFALLDMVIKSLMSGTYCAEPDELLYERNVVFDFLSYGYAQHVKEGVKAQYEAVGSTEQSEHNISLQEQLQFHQYYELHAMTEYPDDFDRSDKQQAFIGRVKAQLNACAEIHGCTGTGATSHTPSHTLDLAKDHAPRTDHRMIGFLECSACRGPYIFYDKLRQIAMAKFEETATTLLSDLLLTIHHCERRTFRYMAHVVQNVLQHHLMNLERNSLGGDTMYVVFDFKQKFHSKRFREGGDAYYGKKGMLWFGAAAYIKQQHSTGCGRSYIGAKSYGNIEEDRNVTHTFMNDAVEDEYIHEKMHSDDMTDEEAVDDENEELEVVLDDENGEVVLDDENGEVALDDENEDVALDDENEEVTSDDENEEVTSDDDEIEEMVLDDKNEEVTSDDENEQVTFDDEIEEVVLDDENDHEEGMNDGKTKNKDVSATRSDTGNECFLHFVDGIVDGDEKADSSVALSCLEATFHVL